MRKRLLVRENGLNNFFKAFFTAKSKGKEDQFIDAVAKADKELAVAWEQLDNTLNKSLQNVYRYYKNSGQDTAEIEAKMKKYGVAIPKD